MENCSDMTSSLAVVGDAMAAGVTRFANEACDGVEVNEDYVPSDYLQPTADLQNLKDYFQRPRLFRRGTVAFADRGNQFLVEIGQGFLITTFPQWLNRLSGVYGVRFKLNFRLQVAATAFHQGILALSYQYGTTASTAFKFQRATSSAASTNLPHVRLDVTESTMCELSVPFVYAYDFWPVTGSLDYDSLGVVALNSIVPPISVSGLSPFSYECYVFLTDMEFFGADNNATTVITLQSGVIAKELRESKLISRSLTGAAKVAGFVSKHVPMLSGLAGSTAWALDIAAGAAKYFGFSKPLIQDPVMRILRQWYAGDSQVDVAMAGFSVGGFQSNTLAVDGSLGATNVDEMSLAFVLSQWSQICVGFVATTDTHSKVIYASPVSPSCWWFRAPASAPYCNKVLPLDSSGLISQSGNCILPSTLMYVSSYFRSWRGTVKYRFTFAKTKFHGGRYMVSFNPSNVWLTVPTGIAAIEGPEVASSLVQPYGYSMIMDLRDGNVFEFSVPYIVENPWAFWSSSVGGISVVCIDPLQSGSAVSSTVPFLVEVAGGDDFMVADYAGNLLVPYSKGTIYQQSGDITQKGSSTVSGLDAVVKSATIDPSQYTIGERYTSLKQCIMIPSYTSTLVAASNTSSTILAPWHNTCITSQIGAGGVTSPIPTNTSFIGAGQSPGTLSKMYAWVRGSTDYHIYSPNTPAGNLSLIAEQIPVEGGRGVPTGLQTYRNNFGATPKVISYGDTPLHIRLPAFQRLARLIAYADDGSGFTRLIGNYPVLSSLFRTHFTRLISTTGSTAVTIYIGCAAGDDAMMSGFIGPEPCVIPNSLGTNRVFGDWTI